MNRQHKFIGTCSERRPSSFANGLDKAVAQKDTKCLADGSWSGMDPKPSCMRTCDVILYSVDCGVSVCALPARGRWMDASIGCSLGAAAVLAVYGKVRRLSF